VSKISVIPARLYWMKYFLKYKVEFFTTSVIAYDNSNLATSIGKAAVAAVSSKTSSKKDICVFLCVSLLLGKSC